MKKRVFLLVLMVSSLLTVSVFADAPYADINALYQSWNDNRPDYVTGVWIQWDPDVLTSYLDGENEAPESQPTIVGLVPGEAGEAGLAEIRSLVADLSDVIFVEQKYSYNYLRSLQSELEVWLQDAANPAGLVAMGVMEMENYLEITVLDLNADTTKDFMEMCRKTYGDAVAFVQGGPITTDLLDLSAVPVISIDSAEEPHDYRWIAWAAVAVIILGTAGFLLLRRRASLLQTETGDLAVTPTHSRKDVEAMIRAAGEVPSESTDQAVLNRAKQK